MRVEPRIVVSGLLVAGLALAQAQGGGTGAKDASTGATDASTSATDTGSAAKPAAAANEGPCKQDVETFCADVEPGGGRLYKCLSDHEADLSNTCKKRLASLRSTGAECRDDVEKFCSSVPHAKGRLAQCLSEHLDELSEPCKALASRAKKPAPKAHEATPAVPAAPGKPPAADAGAR